MKALDVPGEYAPNLPTTDAVPVSSPKPVSNPIPTSVLDVVPEPSMQMINMTGVPNPNTPEQDMLGLDMSMSNHVPTPDAVYVSTPIPTSDEVASDSVPIPDAVPTYAPGVPEPDVLAKYVPTPVPTSVTTYVPTPDAMPVSSPMHTYDAVSTHDEPRDDTSMKKLYDDPSLQKVGEDPCANILDDDPSMLSERCRKEYNGLTRK